MNSTMTNYFPGPKFYFHFYIKPSASKLEEFFQSFSKAQQLYLKFSRMFVIVVSDCQNEKGRDK